MINPNNFIDWIMQMNFNMIAKANVDVGHFHDGLAPVVEKDQPISFIRSDGTVAFVFDKYKDEAVKSVSDFHEGRARFKTASGKYGYINTKGKVIIEPIYDDAGEFYNNVAYVAQKHGDNKEAFLIDRNGKNYFKVNPDYSYIGQMNENLLTYTETNKNWEISSGVLNMKGEKIIKASSKYATIGLFENGYAPFKSPNGEWGLIDKKGDIAIRAKYTDLYLCKNVLVFSEKGKWGLLNLEGEILLEPEYEDIYFFVGNNKYTYAQDDKEWVLIDKKGKEVKLKTVISQIRFEGSYNTDIESDYVDIQAEVNNVMKLLNDDGTIDKMTYQTTPEEFANLYDKEYKVSDIENEKVLYHFFSGYEYFEVGINAEYKLPLIIPQYEKKWKESYWGGGHWENEISSYSYNANAIPETFHLYFIPEGKLKDKGKEIFDITCGEMKKRGYTQLSIEEKDGQRSVFWEKKKPHLIHAGVHFTEKNNRIGIAVGK